MASVLQRPVNRGDIVSTILNDYFAMDGDREYNGDVSPVLYDPVPPPKDGQPFLPLSLGEQTKSPVHPMMGPFRLRVIDESRPSSPASITWRSISRSSKPSSLRLTKSNGSTAGSTSPPLSDSSFETVDINTTTKSTEGLSQRGSSSSRSGSEERAFADQDLAPPVPPKAANRNQVGTSDVGRVQRLVEMGNRTSKTASLKSGSAVADESGKSPSMGSQLKSVLKTRPATSTGRPTLADTMTRGLRKPKPEQKPGRSSLLSEISNRVGSGTSPSQPPAVGTVKSTSTGLSRDTVSSAARTEDTSHTDQTVIHHKSSPEHQREPSLSAGSDSATDDHIPPSPLTPVLPPTIPLSEDTSSDYGVAGAGPTDIVTPPGDAESIRQGINSRRKSSTGIDIFRKTSALHSAHTYLNALTPSPTPSPSPKEIQPPRTLHLSPSQPVLSPSPSPRQTRMNYSSQATTINAKPSTFPNLSALNASRPSTTTAPPLSTLHLYCFQRHAKYHFSRNTYAPVACMLCYSESIEERWSCAWCALRICRSCKSDLDSVKGRDLGVLVGDGSMRIAKDGMTPRTENSRKSRHSGMSGMSLGLGMKLDMRSGNRRQSQGAGTIG